MNFKTKLAMKVSVTILLDIIALGIIGYVSLQTMSLLLWTILLVLGLMFAYDAARAVTFLSELLSKKH